MPDRTLTRPIPLRQGLVDDEAAAGRSNVVGREPSSRDHRHLHGFQIRVGRRPIEHFSRRGILRRESVDSDRRVDPRASKREVLNETDVRDAWNRSNRVHQPCIQRRRLRGFAVSRPRGRDSDGHEAARIESQRNRGNATKALQNSPAPTRSISASANCSATSERRSLDSELPPTDPAAPTRSDAPLDALVERIAGQTPHNNAVSTDAANATTRTRPSTATSSTRGRRVDGAFAQDSPRRQRMRFPTRRQPTRA